jgi:ATP-dependent Clp protease ATP-binding subunit ClpA
MYPLSMATENYRKAFEIATTTAVEEMHTGFIGSEHLLYAFLRLPECEAYKILTEAGVTLEGYRKVFAPATFQTKGGKGVTPNTEKMYNRAVEEAQKEGLPATTAHVLY